MKSKIIVLGANGQLGQQATHSLKIEDKEIVFLSSKDLDITSLKMMREKFQELQPSYVLNFAAFTDVNLAESNPESAFLVNELGAKNVSICSNEVGAILIHISTDYVFDGNKNEPYSEVDVVNPINNYGLSKLNGENEIQTYCEAYIIIRTSWIFGSYGKNFFKTILNLSRARSHLEIISDQIGSPTSSLSIIHACIEIIKYLDNSDSSLWGIYHFSNVPAVSWYEFAENIIFNAANIGILARSPSLTPIQSIVQANVALRPKYSVLNTKKIEDTFKIRIVDWRDSLKAITSF